ncbi:hypothetical protein SCA6_009703 [Theobroma cacao]
MVIFGQDKASQNHPNAAMPTSNSSHKLRHYPGTLNHMEISQQPMRLSTPCRIPDNPLHYSQVSFSITWGSNHDSWFQQLFATITHHNCSVSGIHVLSSVLWQQNSMDEDNNRLNGASQSQLFPL